MVSLQKELKTTIETVKNAIKITEWFNNVGFKSFQKKDDSPVTLADYASQFYINTIISENFPGDQIIAEEEESFKLSQEDQKKILACYNELGMEVKLDETREKRKSNRQWTVDPIDGTKGFQKKLSYAVGVGLMINSKPQICVIGVPNFDETGTAIFIAEKGNGSKVSLAEKNFSSIKVSTQSNITKTSMCLSLHYNEPWVKEFANSAKITNFIQMDSMAKFCLVAIGNADLYIKPMNKDRSFSWDFLPGTLLVEEAGGRVSDLYENPLKFDGEKTIVAAPGLLASNSLIHEEVIKLMQEFELVHK